MSCTGTDNQLTTTKKQHKQKQN